MNVVHATPTFLPVVGGTEINVRHLALHSRPLGITPSILTYNMDQRWRPSLRSRTESIDGLDVFRCAGIRPYPDLPWVRGILPGLCGVHVLPLSAVRRRFRRADVIHLHDEVELSLALAAAGTARPRIMHIRTLTFLIDAFRRSAARRWLLDRCAQFFICNSSTTAGELVQLGVAADRLVVIPNGVDTELFHPGPAGRERSRRVLFVGRIQRAKGLHVLLEAISRIERPVELLIVAAGITDPAYHTEMLAQSERLTDRQRHRVRWIDALGQEELSGIYRDAAVFACPSFNEPFGNVVIEAMACGTPVVASRSGGPLDIIDSGKDGLLVEEGNAAALAEALEHLLDAPAAADELSRRALDKIHQHFSWPRIAARVVDVYHGLLTGSGNS